jgi:uncharacterized protein YbjQ (UPF0145 family)
MSITVTPDIAEREIVGALGVESGMLLVSAVGTAVKLR